MILLEQHLVAKLSVGVDLFQKESHQVNQQFYAENITNREFAIAKESEFTPVQFSSLCFLSGFGKFYF